MKNLLFIFSILAVISFQGFPQGFTNIDNDINDYIFSGEWQQAKMLIEDQIKQNPEKPKYYFMKAHMYYLSRYFANTGMSRDSTINSVHYYASQAIQKGEQLEQTTEVKFYIGCAYGYIARAHGMWQEWWSAYWAASSCENYLEEVINEDPEFYDAYFELGVINYYPDAAISGFTSTLAWIGGMSGDRELGLKYLNMVTENGNLFKSEADIALGLIHRNFENDPNAALKYYNRVLETYPENNLAIGQKRQIEFVILIDDKGVDYLVENFDSLKVDYGIDNANYLNNMGYLLMNRQRMDDALVVFKLNLQQYPHVANCYDSLAECFMNRNENEQAIKYYKLAYEKIPGDTTATEEFKQFLREGIEERLQELEAKVSS